MSHPFKHTRAATALAIGTLLLAAACATTPPRQTQFETPDEAARQLVAAARADDLPQLEKILGPDSKDVLHSGDEVSDRAGRERFVTAYDEKHRLENREDGSVTLVIGELEWPLPIPIVSRGGVWVFDTAAGREEVVNRRIGRNELEAIQVCLAMADAQFDYAEKDRDGDGILEYATKFRSTPGQHDGLYWPEEEGDEQSPLGELAAQATLEGYNPSRASETPRPYHGYFYRILTGQGANAPGGAYGYTVRGNMIGGFAILAFPAEYGVSGVMSFLVNHDGVVYEKDLGPDTGEIAAAMQLYDPDGTWRKSPQ